MELERNLKRYMNGKDVREIKGLLFALGYYDTKVKQITNSTYGNDTYNAVKKFQKKYNLVVDGIVGKNTFAKLMEVTGQAEPNERDYIVAKAYPRLSESARVAINEALKRVNLVRREVVKEALKYATDASVAPQFDYPSSLYIWGGNLFNKNGRINVVTEEYLSTTYKKKNLSRCTNGRLEMMIEAVRQNPYITGADCSGGIIGLFRHFNFVKTDTDATANSLCSTGYSTSIKKVDLTAGDFVGRNGHICLYVGGGYMVEWAGGEFGCQVTKMSDHKCWSFTKRKYVTQKACTKYRRPKAYK